MTTISTTNAATNTSPTSDTSTVDSSTTESLPEENTCPTDSTWTSEDSYDGAQSSSDMANVTGASQCAPYTVQEGDYLIKIAEEQNTPLDQIKDQNPELERTDVNETRGTLPYDTIYPGDQVQIMDPNSPDCEPPTSDPAPEPEPTPEPVRRTSSRPQATIGVDPRGNEPSPTRWGIAREAADILEYSEGPIPNESEIKQAISAERDHLWDTKYNDQWNAKSRTIVFSGSPRNIGPNLQKGRLQVEQQMTLEARQNVFQYLYDSDPSFRLTNPNINTLVGSDYAD